MAPHNPPFSASGAGRGPITKRAGGRRLPAAPRRVPALRRCNRRVRIGWMLLGIMALSAFDLWMTLAHLSAGTLIEQNPIVRALIAHAGPAALVAWKALSVGTTTSILLGARRHCSAEIGAIVARFVLAWLTVRWVQYAAEVDSALRTRAVLIAPAADGAARPRAVPPAPRPGHRPAEGLRRSPAEAPVAAA